jgi:hypothetical protein
VRDDGDAVLGGFSFPPVVAVKCVLTMYLIGSGEIDLIAALILSESGANCPSTMMMASSPTAMVIISLAHEHVDCGCRDRWS